MRDRCWIIGTGPSLDLVDLSMLEDETTISCNSIFLRMEPTYYCVSDNIVIKKYKIDLDKRLLKSKLVLKESIRTNREVLHFVKIDNDTPNKNVSDFLNSDDWDLTMKTAKWTKSVIMDFCFPLAASLGFKKVYLLGCDAKANGHFASDRSASGHAFHTRKAQWTKIKWFCDKYGIEVFNCFQESAINLFPKVDYLDIIKE